MGDENIYGSRPCPDCGERLAHDARRCACGWGASKRGKGEVASNPVCTWHSGMLVCRYPVGRFDLGARSGYCVFHRAKGTGIDAARIAQESEGHTPEQYLERARRLVYGDGSDNANVAALRARLRRVQAGETVGILATRLLDGLGGPDPVVDERIAAADLANMDAINRSLRDAEEAA